MPTLKSRHSRWSRYNATPGAHARRHAALDAARIAGPTPAYPPDAPLYGDWLGGRIHGHLVVMRLMRDPAHRSDQWAAEIDGEVVFQAAGLTSLWNALHKRWARAPSRRMLAGLEA